MKKLLTYFDGEKKQTLLEDGETIKSITIINNVESRSQSFARVKYKDGRTSSIYSSFMKLEELPADRELGF